jgi:hypothetical protein
MADCPAIDSTRSSELLFFFNRATFIFFNEKFTGSKIAHPIPQRDDRIDVSQIIGATLHIKSGGRESSRC